MIFAQRRTLSDTCAYVGSGRQPAGARSRW